MIYEIVIVTIIEYLGEFVFGPMSLSLAVKAFFKMT